MSNSRSQSPDAIDIEMDPASRNVRPRPSDDPFLGARTSDDEESDPSEEPFEDEEVPSPARTRSPSPSLSASPPSPLPPASPPSPMAPPSPIRPSLRFSSRNQGTPIQWDWMPTGIRAWRNAEQVPILPTPDGVDSTIHPLTGEAIHHTIPVVVARLRTHDEQLEGLERVLEGPPPGVEILQQQVAGLGNDMSDLRDEVVDTHTRGAEEMEALTLRVLSAEDRVLAAENRAQRMETQVDAMQQEIIALRAERDQLRETTLYASRVVDRLERLCERLR